MRDGATQVADGVHVTKKGDTSLVQVDIEKLPEIGRSVTATFATVVEDDGGAQLVFGQSTPLQEGLLAALIVPMSMEALRNSIADNNVEFVERTLTQAKSTSSSIEKRTWSRDLLGNATVVYERGSIISYTFSGDEADVRIWRLTPSQLRKMGPKRIVESITPVIMVFLSTSELARFLLSARAVLEVES